MNQPHPSRPPRLTQRDGTNFPLADEPVRGPTANSKQKDQIIDAAKLRQRSGTVTRANWTHGGAVLYGAALGVDRRVALAGIAILQHATLKAPRWPVATSSG